MILEYATLESSVHIRMGRNAAFHIISPFTGVCRQTEAELQRLLRKYTPILWRQAREIIVDVYNLNFYHLVHFLNSLTEQDLADLGKNNTKITPRLRFGRCPRKYRTRRQIRKMDMAPLVLWLTLSTRPSVRWSFMASGTYAFVIRCPVTTVMPWIGALSKFIVDLSQSPSGALARPDTLDLRRAISAIVYSGVDALRADTRVEVTLALGEARSELFLANTS